MMTPEEAGNFLKDVERDSVKCVKHADGSIEIELMTEAEIDDMYSDDPYSTAGDRSAERNFWKAHRKITYTQEEFGQFIKSIGQYARKIIAERENEKE